MSKRRVDKSVAGAALLFAALGDPTRMALLHRLSRDGPASISVLADDFHTTRQGVTKHLQVLADAGLVRDLKVGRERRWHFEAAPLEDARRALDAFAARWDRALDRLKASLER